MIVDNNYKYSDITGKIIACAIEVHRHLGPGLLEKAYEECLAYELRIAGYHAELQKPLPVVYKEIKLEHGYRIDILVDNKVLVEVKSVEALNPVHEAQILTYLKFSGIEVGLLINFNVKLLKNGIKKYVY
jgi:GxxExxY protein